MCVHQSLKERHKEASMCERGRKTRKKSLRLKGITKEAGP
jgi:hypothetical protein